MKKFSDVELSRILSQAASGYLGNAGLYGQTETACLVQTALATYDGTYDYANFPPEYRESARWFDKEEIRHNIDIVGNPDVLLAELENIGIA